MPATPLARPLALPVLLACVTLLVRPGWSVAQPTAATRWILAEGASNAFFTEEIVVANPSASAAEVTITYLMPASGVPPPAPIVTSLTIAPTSRATIRVNEVPGLDGIGAVSAIVESTNGVDIVVERSMYWGRIPGTAHPAAGHNSPGVAATATEWFLAEGSTGFFETFILLANPSGSESAHLEIEFLRRDGSVVRRTREISPHTRENVWVNVEVPELAFQPFSTVVRSTNGVGIVVERAMYFGGAFEGGHGTVAVTAPAREWLFGEGFTGGTPRLEFDTFLLLANPQGTPAHVALTLLLEDGTTAVRTYTLAPTSRLDVWFDLLPEVAHTAFSMRIASDVPILAERAMYWGVGRWHESHASPGVERVASAWAFAEGREDGIDDSGVHADTFFLLANVSASPIDVRATFLREDGTGLVRVLSIPPTARFTLAASTYPELTNQRFAAFFECMTSCGFVAERALYWGDDYRGGHASAGVPWSGPVATPPEPPSPTVTGISPSEGSTVGGTEVVVTGTDFPAGTRVTFGGAPAEEIRVINARTIVARAPAHVAGTVGVEVVTHAGSITVQRAFTYVSPVPSTLAFGDSITFGVSSFVSGEAIQRYATTGYPERLRLLLEDAYATEAISVVNGGVPGECASDVCAPPWSGESRLAQVLSPDYDLLVLLEGVNDLNGVRPVASVAQSLARMVRMAHESGIAVILSTLLPVVPDQVAGFHRIDPTLVRQLNAEIRGIAARESAHLVDMYWAFGGDLPDPALLSPDGLHPSDAGYQHLANVLFDAIRRLFGSDPGR